MNVRKNDKVFIISGNYKGKIAKVLHVLPDKDRLIIEGINMMKKHSRPTRNNPKGGVITKEGTIHRSNVKIYCGSCNSPTKVSFRVVENKGSKSSKLRCCRLCGAEL